MKRCTDCKQEKAVVHFGRDKSRHDGLNAKCKDCHRIRSAIYNKTPEGRASQNASKRRIRAADPARTKWRNAVGQAKRSGKLKPLDACECCGSTKKLEAHHPSYAEDMKLVVTWLCIPCHRQIHEEVA